MLFIDHFHFSAHTDKLHFFCNEPMPKAIQEQSKQQQPRKISTDRSSADSQLSRKAWDLPISHMKRDLPDGKSVDLDSLSEIYVPDKPDLTKHQHELTVRNSTSSDGYSPQASANSSVSQHNDSSQLSSPGPSPMLDSHSNNSSRSATGCLSTNSSLSATARHSLNQSQDSTGKEDITGDNSFAKNSKFVAKHATRDKKLISTSQPSSTDHFPAPGNKLLGVVSTAGTNPKIHVRKVSETQLDKNSTGFPVSGRSWTSLLTDKDKLTPPSSHRKSSLSDNDKLTPPSSRRKSSLSDNDKLTPPSSCRKSSLSDGDKLTSPSSQSRSSHTKKSPEFRLRNPHAAVTATRSAFIPANRGPATNLQPLDYSNDQSSYLSPVIHTAPPPSPASNTNSPAVISHQNSVPQKRVLVSDTEPTSVSQSKLNSRKVMSCDSVQPIEVTALHRRTVDCNESKQLYNNLGLINNINNNNNNVNRKSDIPFIDSSDESLKADNVHMPVPSGGNEWPEPAEMKLSKSQLTFPPGYREQWTSQSVAPPPLPDTCDQPPQALSRHPISTGFHSYPAPTQHAHYAPAGYSFSDLPSSHHNPPAVPPKPTHLHHTSYKSNASIVQGNQPFRGPVMFHNETYEDIDNYPPERPGGGNMSAERRWSSRPQITNVECQQSGSQGYAPSHHPMSDRLPQTPQMVVQHRQPQIALSRITGPAAASFTGQTNYSTKPSVMTDGDVMHPISPHQGKRPIGGSMPAEQTCSVNGNGDLLKTFAIEKDFKLVSDISDFEVQIFFLRSGCCFSFLYLYQDILFFRKLE